MAKPFRPPQGSSNYRMFAERGDAWDAPDHPARPSSLSPAGSLSLSARAHATELRRHMKPRAPIDSQQVTQNPDFDQYLVAGKAMPLWMRLAKERNTLCAPLETGAISAPRSIRAKLASAALKSRRHVVKA